MHDLPVVGCLVKSSNDRGLEVIIILSDYGNRKRTATGGPVVECLPRVREVVGSNPRQVIPTTFKMYLMLPC